MTVIEASSKNTCMTTKNLMKLRWNVDEASMTTFSMTHVNGTFTKKKTSIWAGYLKDIFFNFRHRPISPISLSFISLLLRISISSTGSSRARISTWRWCHSRCHSWKSRGFCQGFARCQKEEEKWSWCSGRYGSRLKMIDNLNILGWVRINQSLKTPAPSAFFGLMASIKWTSAWFGASLTSLEWKAWILVSLV